MFKIDEKLLLTVLVAMALYAVLDKLVLGKLVDKIPHLEEMFEA